MLVRPNILQKKALGFFSLLVIPSREPSTKKTAWPWRDPNKKMLTNNN